MEKLTLDDIKDLTTYEKEREAIRREVIRLKALRRVSLGDRVSLVFENRSTALAQVQEMVRAERIVDADKIRFEIDTYNSLIPDEGELSATLFIEITDATDIRKELNGFLGLDRPGTLYFLLEGAGRAEARFEEGHSTEERISAVHYVRFSFDEAQREAFVQGRAPVTLVLDHPHYREKAVLPDETRKALSEDLSPRD